MRIANVVHHDDHLTVASADQTQSIVDTSCLIPVSADEPQWHDLTFTDDEIIVPAEPQTIEISWLTVRSLTDPEFDAYLGEQARQEAT